MASRERRARLWVTRDGRLLAFDFATGELADVSAGFVFEPK
ncbi:MAG TPA: hypothetical protein VIL20_28860 [Sandaracinaceae bacterium]